MRKLTPYDELMCICKTPMRIQQVAGGGQETTAAGQCECLALPSRSLPPNLRSVVQYHAWQRSKDLKLTRFKVRGVIVSPVDVMTVVGA